MTLRNTCSNCGTGTSGVSDLCQRCSKLAKFSGRFCFLCNAPIGKCSRSGICGKCRVKLRRSGESEYVKKMVDVSSVLRRKKTGIWTTCHMPGCGEYFELREGQDQVKKSNGTYLAWCSRCKQTPNYKNYGTYTAMIREIKL